MRESRESIAVCLAVPMEVLTSDGVSARCTAWGVERDVSLLLLPDEEVRRGDMLMVHLGHAMHKLDPQQAHEIWALYDEMLAAAEAAGGAVHGA